MYFIIKFISSFINVFSYRIVLIFACTAFVLLSDSCSVQKRRYRKGYHTEVPAKPGVSNNQQAGNESTDTVKYLSSPFYNDSSLATTNYCDSIFLNDGHALAVKLIGRDNNEIKYNNCGENRPAFGIGIDKINFIKRADGYIVNAATLKTNSAPDTSACDKIYLKDGKEKMVYVIETNMEEIKYRECGDRNGIVYGIARKNVLMIKRANGSYDVISTDASENNNPPAPKNTTPKNPDNILNDRFLWFIVRVVLNIFLF